MNKFSVVSYCCGFVSCFGEVFARHKMMNGSRTIWFCYKIWKQCNIRRLWRGFTENVIRTRVQYFITKKISNDVWFILSVVWCTISTWIVADRDIKLSQHTFLWTASGAFPLYSGSHDRSWTSWGGEISKTTFRREKVLIKCTSPLHSARRVWTMQKVVVGHRNVGSLFNYIASFCDTH